jgi:hypothetical protein
VTIRTAAGRRSGAVRAELVGPCQDAGVVPECSKGGDARTGVAVPGSIRLGGSWLPDRPRSIRRLRVRCSSNQRPRLVHALGLARRPRSLVVGAPSSALVTVPRLVLS